MRPCRFPSSSSQFMYWVQQKKKCSTDREREGMERKPREMSGEWNYKVERISVDFSSPHTPLHSLVRLWAERTHIYIAKKIRSNRMCKKNCREHQSTSFNFFFSSLCSILARFCIKTHVQPTQSVYLTCLISFSSFFSDSDSHSLLALALDDMFRSKFFFISVEVISPIFIFSSMLNENS